MKKLKSRPESKVMESLQKKNGRPPSPLDSLPPLLFSSHQVICPSSMMVYQNRGLSAHSVPSGSLMSPTSFPLASKDTLAFMEGARVPGVFHFQLRMCPRSTSPGLEGKVPGHWAASPWISGIWKEKCGVPLIRSHPWETVEKDSFTLIGTPLLPEGTKLGGGAQQSLCKRPVALCISLHTSENASSNSFCPHHASLSLHIVVSCLPSNYPMELAILIFLFR